MKISNLRFFQKSILFTIQDKNKMLEVLVKKDSFLRLRNASLQHLSNWRLIAGGVGVHWEDIDEDISVEEIFRIGEKRET